MANEKNLKPSEYSLSQEEAKRGGIASGESRRRKANLRKAVQDVMNGMYKDKRGQDVSGAGVLALTLFSVATDKNNRQCIQAIRLMNELYGDGISPEEKRKLKAEIRLLEAKADSIQMGGDASIEDLAPLAEMLKDDNNG